MDSAGREGIDWPLALLLAGSFVGFAFVSLIPSFLGIPSRPISVAFRAFMVAAAVVVFARWLAGSVRMRGGLATQAFLLFWAILVVRIFWEATVTPLPLDLLWDEYWLFGIGVALVPALALFQIPNTPTLRLALRLTEAMGAFAVIGLSLAGAKAVFEVASGAGGSADEIERLATAVVNPAYLGYMAVTVVVTSGFLIVDALRTEGSRRWPVVVRGAVIVFSVIAMVASASKGPIAVAAIVGVLFLFVRGRRDLAVSAVLVRLAVFAILGVVMLAGAVLLEDLTSLRTVSRFTELGMDQSTIERRDMASGAFNQFARGPILGDDIVELRSRTYPHNVLLESAMATGIVGAALLGALMTYSLLLAWRLLRAGDGREWLAILHVVFWLLAMTAGSLVFTPHIWATTAAVLAAAALPGASRQLQSTA